jgi:hypothetical protein
MSIPDAERFSVEPAGYKFPVGAEYGAVQQPEAFGSPTRASERIPATASAKA